jgi:hypothetical protein
MPGTVRTGRRVARRCPVDGTDVVAALREAGNVVAADAAGGPKSVRLIVVVLVAGRADER